MSNFIAIGNNEPTPDSLPDEIKKIINDGKKRAGFNPDGTPIMSKPYSQPGEKCTDTNQASEDELRAEILTEFKQVHRLAPADYTENCTNVVMSIIRTEKLKLLAEVRERVVGEDKPLQGKYRASGLMSYDMTNHYENSLRAEQRAVLTQLEAEL